MSHPLAAHRALGATTAVVLLALVTSASRAIAQSSGAQEPIRSVSPMLLPPPPPGDDDDIYRPYVTVTPSGGSTLNPTRSVSIDWCDPESTLSSTTRRITLNGVSVTSSFSYVSSSKSGCSGHATSSGAVTLQPDSNRFRAEIKDAAGNLGYRDVVYILAENPVISTTPHNGANRDLSRCIADCFDAVMGYSTPSYQSFGASRSLSLVYRSSLARPIATVAVDAKDTTATKVPTRISLKLKDSNDAFVTFLGNRQEVFYVYKAGAWQRLGAQFDASNLPTGAHNYTVIVTSYFSDNTMKAATAPIRVLVVNELESVYGAGWSIAGVQRLHLQSDGGAVVTDGAGSVAYFSGLCALSPCSYKSPAGDFTTLSRQSSADGTKFNRRYPDGAVVAFWANGLAAYSQDRFGNRTTFTFDSTYRLTTVTDPAGQSLFLDYWHSTPTNGVKPNSLKWIRQEVSGAGRFTTVRVDGASGNLASIHDALGEYALRASYDSEHQLEHWLDRRGNDWNLTYDCWRHVDSKLLPTVKVRGQDARPTIRQASAISQVAICGTSTLGTFASPAPAALPDSIHASVTNQRGHTTRYQLDHFGTPTRIEEPLGRTTIVRRDTAGRQVYVRGPSGNAKVYTYDGLDLISVYDSTTKQRLRMAYDPTYHQITWTSNGAIQTWNYWSNGKLDSTDAGVRDGTRRTRFTYETINGRITGRVASRTDPMGHITTYSYTPTDYVSINWRNLYSVTAAGRTTKYMYDWWGRQNAEITPKGDTSWTRHDNLNRVVWTAGPLGDTTRFDYDSLFLRSVRDAEGQVYTFTTNALGWVERRTDPNGLSESFVFDSAGLIVARVNRRQQTISMTYDALGELTSTTADANTTTYRTDPLGRFVAAANAESTDTTFFDPAGRAIQEVTVWPTGQRFVRTSTYDSTNTRTRLQVAPWSTSVSYHFNELMQLDTLTDLNGGKTRLRYNSDGRLSSFRLPTAAGLTITYGYPETHDLSDVTYSNAAVDDEIGNQFAFTRNGQIEKRIDYSSDEYEIGRRYWYDAAGRLTRYEDYTDEQPQDLCPDGDYDVDPKTGESCRDGGRRTVDDAAQYTYDLVGNRTDLGAIVGTGNRLVRFDGDTIVYDADGNMIRRWTLAGGRSDVLSWNSSGQLVSVTHNGMTTTFGYDGLGRRVRKTTNGVSKRYVHDGQNLLAELDAAGNRIAEYTYYPGIDRPHSVRYWSAGSATTYYYATESPGHVIGLIDSSNLLVARYSYSPWGQLQHMVGSVPNVLLFGAREYDSETGLYYNRARYYDPSLGRFISEDPIGLRGGINPYVYASNDPVNNLDPSGLWSLKGLWKSVTNAVKDVIRWAPVAAFVVITGGTGSVLAAFEALGATALGSAVAAGAEALVTDNSFWGSFQRNVGIASANLFVGVTYGLITRQSVAAGADRGSYFLRGYVQVDEPAWGGLTLGSSSVFGRGQLATIGGHEFGHTLQFFGLSTIPASPWTSYLALGGMGLVGQTNSSGLIPGLGALWESMADVLGGGTPGSYPGSF